MKYLLTLILLVSPLTDLERIAKVNKIKKEAKSAYTTGDFQKAIDKYSYLLDSMQVEDPNINLNLANAYYKLSDTTNAVNEYQALLKTTDNVIKSVAHQQLGIIKNREKKFEEALGHFKNAIKANPANDEARYNYEMLKKMLEEKEKQEEENKDKQNKDQQNKDQKNKDKQEQDQQQEDQKNKDQQDQNKEGEQEKKDQEQQQNQDQKEEGKEGEEKDNEQQPDEKKKDPEEQKQKPKEGEEGDKKEGEQEQMNSLSDKLKEMNISEEKAKMILEALKNNEIQYIQQNKRKAKKRKDPGKPDW